MQSLAHLPAELIARKDLDIRVGDTLRVQVKIPEKSGNFRLQAFEGLVLARKHGTEPGATITVRKMSHGVGVERVFPLYATTIESFTVVKRSRVRRSKLYYIRTKVAREIRRKMRNFVSFIAATRSKADIAADAVSAPQPEVAPDTETTSTE